MVSCYLCSKELGETGLEKHAAAYDELEYAIGTQNFIALLESPDYKDKPLLICNDCRIKLKSQKGRGTIVMLIVLVVSTLVVLISLFLVVRSIF